MLRTLHAQPKQQANALSSKVAGVRRVCRAEGMIMIRAQARGMSQTRCRGATTTSQHKLQRAQAAAGVRGVRLALSGIEAGEVLAPDLAQS